MAGLNRFEVAPKKRICFLDSDFCQSCQQLFWNLCNKWTCGLVQCSGSHDLGISSLSSLVQWIGGAAEQGLLRFVYASKTWSRCKHKGWNRLNQKWSHQLVLVILILLVLLVIIIIIIIAHHYIDQSYPWSNFFQHSSHLHKDVQAPISISQNQWDPWKNQKNAPCFLSHAMVAFLRAATSSRLRTCATINRPSDSTDVFLLALRLHQQEWED